LKFLDICFFSGLLCLAMDLALFDMIARTEYIFSFKNSCLSHTREVLNHPLGEQGNCLQMPTNLGSEVQHVEAGHNQDAGAWAGWGEEGGGGEAGAMTEQVTVNRNIGIPIVVHVSYAGEVPTHEELEHFFIHHLFHGSFSARRLVVTRLKVITPLGSAPSPTSACISHVQHQDFTAASESDKDGFSVLTMRPLQSPTFETWLRLLEGSTWFQKTLKKRLTKGTNVVEVSMLVCGPCRTLQERRELCGMLERERDTMQRCKDDAGFMHVNRRLSNFRKTVHSIDEPLIQLMTERLNSSFLIQSLQNCAEQRGQQGASTPSTLDQLQLMFGPTFKALKEKMFACSLSQGEKSLHARAGREKIKQFLEVCSLAGVPSEYAEILACLPAAKLLSVQVWV
jgi:hypothetical protein